MPIQTNSLNKNLYDLLTARGYDPIPMDSDAVKAGKSVPPEEADVFKFTFSKGGKPVDDVLASIDGQYLTLYYSKDIAEISDDINSEADFDDSWYGFLKFLKKWAFSKRLKFKLEPKEKVNSDMAQRTYMKKKEQIEEGYYPMGKMASYNDNIPTVKIVLQHTRQIQEGEQRYRNIAKIFLENTDGERILAPTTKPGIAQIYARHLAEGGVPNDERWNHVKSLCEEYSKMAGFVRAVRGSQFNESAQRLVEAGLSHYTSLRETLGKMRGSRGYNAYFESWTPTLMETEGDETTINELFVQETLDPRIESVMPILSKLSKTLGEMQEVNELAEWANDLLEDAIDDANAAKKKMTVPAYQRKAQGGDWKVSQKDLDALPAGTRTSSQGLAAHAKRIGLDSEEGVEEGLVNEGQYEMMLRNGQVKKFVAKDDADAKRIAAGHGAKSVIKLKGGVPAGKIAEQGVAEGRLSQIQSQAMALSRKANAVGVGKEWAHMLKTGSTKEINAALDSAWDRADGAAMTGLMTSLQEIVNYLSGESNYLPSNTKEQGVAEGSTSKEKQKTPYRDINSPEYRAAVDKQKEKMKQDAAAEPGKKLLGKIEKKNVGEDLDSNQKRVGQLGPTEKVKNNNIGKLVGANESIEYDPLDELKRLLGK